MARFGIFSVFRGARFGTVAVATGLLMAACGGGSPGPVGSDPGGETPAIDPNCKDLPDDYGVLHPVCCPDLNTVPTLSSPCGSQVVYGCEVPAGGTCTFLATDTSQPEQYCPGSMNCSQCMLSGSTGFTAWCGQQR